MRPREGPESIMLRESPSERDKHHMISLMWDLKNRIN